MQLILLKSKLHQARITAINLHYEGSCEIDANLMAEVDILPYEQIHLYNLNNGQRWITYAIQAPAHTGIIAINGAASRLALPGDTVIICAYGYFSAENSRGFSPKIRLLDEHNRILDSAHPSAKT